MSKDCCKPEKSKTARGKIDPFIAGIVVVTVLLLGGVVIVGSKMGATPQVVADTQVSLAVENNTHDWGTIDINDGIASKTFTIENTSSEPLRLHDVKTSCMCTTAQLVTAEASSKKFGMHEKSPSVFEVKPGETAELVIEFDPAFHGPSGVGPISRTVTMDTNAAANPTLSFQLAANVVKE